MVNVAYTTLVIRKEVSSSNEAATIGMNYMVYVNEARQATMNVAESGNGNVKGLVSFAKMVIGEPSRNFDNFCTLVTLTGNGADVVVSKESFRAISERIGPWFIHNTPLILKKWTPDANLLKVDVGNVLVSVTLHDVPFTVFSEDGLSVIATKLGTPLMLDSYTSDMCMDSCGRSSYVRVMIELRADVELKDIIDVAIPKIVDDWPKKYHLGVLKNMKNPRQAVREIQVGPKLGFNPKKQVYQPDCKKNGASAIESDDDLVTNRRDLEVLVKGANFDVTTMDDNGKPINKLDSSVNVNGDSEVEEGSGIGYGIKSLLEKWKETIVDDGYDPYNDDISSKTVRGNTTRREGNHRLLDKGAGTITFWCKGGVRRYGN
ncbi:putative reverse transcriptase domain-containing protein [Tanacetum coccineum]